MSKFSNTYGEGSLWHWCCVTIKYFATTLRRSAIQYWKVKSRFPEYVPSPILLSGFARTLRYFHLGRRYVTSWRVPDGSIRLGSIWCTRVTSFIPIWGNGEPMFNICHTYSLGMNFLISFTFVLCHFCFSFKWTWFRQKYQDLTYTNIVIQHRYRSEFNNWYVFGNG